MLDGIGCTLKCLLSTLAHLDGDPLIPVIRSCELTRGFYMKLTKGLTFSTYRQTWLRVVILVML